MDQGNGAQWLTLAEAAPGLGLSLDGLRARIRRGQISSRKGNDGKLRVSVLGTELESTHERTGDGHAQTHGQTHERAQPADLLPDLLEARERAARAEGALEAEARRSSDLLASLELERAARSRLEAELTELRRPLLIRLVEAWRR